MTFAGGPAVAVGTWPAGNVLSGAAVVTASNFVNGNLSTPFIGLTPITVSNLSPDYFATSLIPNAGPVVTSIGTPYNDAGDKYHVVVDFTATTGGSTPGTLPANSIFAILDLDITENYRNITATNAANAQIVTPWINGPNGYFDMTNPMIPQGSLIPNPTIAGPVGGVYQMFGVSYNFDVGMWLFKTTQDVKTIAFDMEKGSWRQCHRRRRRDLGLLYIAHSRADVCRAGVRRTGHWRLLVPPGAALPMTTYRGPDSTSQVRTVFTLQQQESLMNKYLNRLLTLACFCSAAILVTRAQADPLTGRDLLKFEQKPMVATAYGWRNLFRPR